VRVGTFQFFAARGDEGATRQLADYVIERHYPEAAAAANPYRALLRAVISTQARLVASWMNVGFIHGVMNTDNMSICGETIDFGPCAFMDEYDPARVFSSIDHRGRYAYANQPAAAQWNLARFAETLLPMLDSDRDRAIQVATLAVTEFAERYAEHRLAGMRRKLGLFLEEEGDGDLVSTLESIMEKAGADFTVTFRKLCAAAEGEPGEASFAEGLPAAEVRDWLMRWRSRLRREPQPASEHAAFMRLVNPWVIPRNHRIEEVIAAAVERADFAPFEELLHVLARPYEDRSGMSPYGSPPRPEQRVLQTFCGT
jgi:uncharacterized protein YdiU (UPF0061 family)